MEVSGIDAYVAAFLARGAAGAPSGRATVGEPGIHGTLPSREDPRARLLVTDDRAHDLLAAALPGVRTGMVTVFAAAARSLALVDRTLGWPAKPLTAMICRDLRAVRTLALPDGLTLRAVRRRPGDDPDGVALEDAVAAAMRADPAIGDPPDAFAAFLRSLPPEFRLFAAVDRGGVVRATSGSAAFGETARVMFVNTDPPWRGRGLGRAMTAAALRAAADAGARHACLDATDMGRSIYRRLGAEVVAEVTQFFRAAALTCGSRG